MIRCLEKLQRGDFALEENCGKNKYWLMGAGPKQRALEVRCFILLFQWHKIKPQRTLTWINSALRENIRRNNFTRNIVNSKDTLDTNLKSWRWCKEYIIYLKYPNKRFSIPQEERRKRLIHFLKNVWTARYWWKARYKVDHPILSADQMPLQKSYFLMVIGGGKTGDIQVNDKS